MKSFPFLWMLLAYAFTLSLIACQPVSEEIEEEKPSVSPTLFYIIRHAEKEAEGNNPGLNAKGQQRAELIAEMLKSAPLDAIYSTPFLRTTSTVEVLAGLKDLEIKIYDPQDTPGLLKEIFEKYPGGNVLIVGHSNTVPGMVNSLIWEDQFENLAETEYHRLFIVAATEKQKGTYSEMYFEPEAGN